eukprot:CAMPEP_0172686696 /NCGR_PEP_ID=MMETSP1074-20121228/21116_1 /TAXON_ID=2916 /ORGANISM="Ceratium fusus, Strain PA161109" /LENGTH=81 /DNA_ID=CAMNT_0013506039 /DNA_START=348 /DNA_END=593 /DNA_ORIENTATION=-
MKLFSSKRSSRAVVKIRTPGAFSAKARKPSGQVRTLRNKMLSSLTPASLRTCIAMRADPPVASMGSQSKTESLSMPGGSFE